MEMERVSENKVKLSFSVSPERFEEGLKYSYNKNKSKLRVQGFRSGKVPRKIIEMQYGKEILFEDAIDFVLGDAYEDAISKFDLEVVSKPNIQILEVSTENGASFSAEVYVKPKASIEQQDYKGVTYTLTDTTVSDGEIDKEIDIARNKNARVMTIIERPVKLNDIVKIDFKGYIDDVPFENGEGKDFELVIGSKTFIDTFEEQIIGHSLNESIDVNVTFPENYHVTELSGKPAVFKVTINDIREKELPEANDDFAQDVSEFETFAEYRENIKQKLQQIKENKAAKDKEDQIMGKIIEKSVVDVPQVMIENTAQNMVYEFEMRLKSQGVTMDAYLEYTGETKEEILKRHLKPAEMQVKGRLALEAVAESEGFEVTEKDVKDEYEKIAKNYNMDIEKVAAMFSEKDVLVLKNDLKVNKAFELVMENAVAV